MNATTPQINLIHKLQDENRWHLNMTRDLDAEAAQAAKSLSAHAEDYKYSPERRARMDEPTQAFLAQYIADRENIVANADPDTRRKTLTAHRTQAEHDYATILRTRIASKVAAFHAAITAPTDDLTKADASALIDTLTGK